MSYVSNAPGTGENASFHFVLPSDIAVMPQGNLYATFWLGGIVADANSTSGGGQAFLEFQFYPSPPAYTGEGSGHEDCLPNGAFNYVWTPGSNDWFACAIVWQLVGATATENAAIATPLDLAGGGDQIFELHSGDQIFVNYSGIAQTTPWNLAVSDVTEHASGTVVLQNGTPVLSPYYRTAASNILSWSASGVGAITFAYEIGHALNPAIPTNPVNGGCTPGDLNCDSYWPGKWSESGQMRLSLPVLGTGPDATFPAYIGFSSSQGGETEVNQSACLMPSFSTLRNCMYPFYLYRSSTYSFTMDADLSVQNITHSYGNEYQFPADISTPAAALESDPHHTVPAPWGTVSVYVQPATASISVNPIGQSQGLADSGGVATGEFAEGPYFVNVSAPGCAPFSEPIYVSTGTALEIPAVLNCGVESALAVATTPASANAPLTVSFLGAANGGVAPYSFGWAFGDGSFATGAMVSHTFGSAGIYTVRLQVYDADGDPATASVSVDVAPPVSLQPSGQYVSLYAQHVNASAHAGLSSFPLSTAFPAGQGDFASFYVIPIAGPHSWTFSLPESTAAPVYLDPSSPIVVHFFLSLPTLNEPAPAGIPITVGASLSGATFGGSGGETQDVSPGGAITEYNLSLLPEVSVLPAGSPITLTVEWYEASVDGNYLAWPVVIHSGQAYPISVDLPLLDPVYLTPAMVSSTASGVVVTTTIVSPFGDADLAHVTGVVDGRIPVSPTVSGSTDTFSISESEVGIGVHTLVVAAYDIQGAYNQVVAQFQLGPETFTVAFTESGLASGQIWEVTLSSSASANDYGYSSTNRIEFAVPNGSYSFAVGGENGLIAFPASGLVTVAGANVGVAIQFTPASEATTVTFTEHGLSKGTSWTVDLAGEIGSSSTGAITFEVPDAASYAFAVGSIAGYACLPSSGSVSVRTNPVSVAISCHHAGVHSPPGHHPDSAPGGPGLQEVGGPGPAATPAILSAPPGSAAATLITFASNAVPRANGSSR